MSRKLMVGLGLVALLSMASSSFCAPGSGSRECEQSGQGAEKGVQWLWYKNDAVSKGRQECSMGRHTFCALSSVQHGNVNGWCSVGQQYGDWKLVVINDGNAAGSKSCAAVCMDIPGLGISASSAPSSSRPAGSVSNAEEVSADESVIGTWRYQAGSFTDEWTFLAGGVLRTRSAPDVTGSWRLKGDTLTTKWPHNGWSNRNKLGSGEGPFSGDAIGPSGKVDHRSTLMQVRGGRTN